MIEDVVFDDAYICRRCWKVEEFLLWCKHFEREDVEGYFGWRSVQIGIQLHKWDKNILQLVCQSYLI